MTTAPDNHDPLDRQARQLHAAALAHVSAPTLARLRDARRDASARRPALAPWLAGGAVAATLALVVLLQSVTSPVAPTAAPTVAANAPATSNATDPAEPLQEDPGFYLWLDSPDATALAME